MKNEVRKDALEGRQQTSSRLTRAAKIKLFFAVWMLCYLGSYFITSRVRESECRNAEVIGFYYLPLHLLRSPRGWWYAERALRYFYFPINAFDRAVLAGPRVGGDTIFGTRW